MRRGGFFLEDHREPPLIRFCRSSARTSVLPPTRTRSRRPVLASFQMRDDDTPILRAASVIVNANGVSDVIDDLAMFI